MATGAVARDYGISLVHYLSVEITYADTTAVAKSMGKMPIGSTIIAAGVTVKEVFNFGTNNRVDIGVSADDDDLGTDVSLLAKGIIIADEIATAGDSATDTAVLEFFATPDITGTAGTTGRAVVWVTYLPPYR